MSASPDLSVPELAFLTLQAVLQAVIICTFGFFCARNGLLPPAAQRFISQLNVNLFTPSLIFTKLASSLSLETLADISIIPVFYAFSTLISYTCSRLMSRSFNLNRRERNFVTALAVFGNSNSVPVTITVAMAYALPGLEWSNVAGDTPDKVASRGITYLLIFQQLGQTLRWSWGYNTLLAKPTPEELIEEQAQITGRYQDLEFSYDDVSCSFHGTCTRCVATVCTCPCTCGSPTPVPEEANINETTALLNGNSLSPNYTSNHKAKAKSYISSSNSSSSSDLNGQHRSLSGSTQVNSSASSLLAIDPKSPTNALERLEYVGPMFIFLRRSFKAFASFMNPPLWTMLVAIVIASVPGLQAAFYTEGTIIERTFSSAVRQMGDVAIPLILVILGSNLSPDETQAPPSHNYNKIIIAGLMSRIFLPSLIIIPLVTLCIKFFPISVLDDPIFLLVAFLLTIAPPAIQLSQISQLNKVFEREMAGVLFWGYAIVTLPVTVVTVVLAVKVMQWVN